MTRIVQLPLPLLRRRNAVCAVAYTRSDNTRKPATQGIGGVMYPMDDAALRTRLLLRQVKEMIARVAEQVERAREARAAAEHAQKELRRGRREKRYGRADSPNPGAARLS